MSNPHEHEERIYSFKNKRPWEVFDHTHKPHLINKHGISEICYFWSLDISDCSDPGWQNNVGEMNPCWSGMERSASGRPGRAKLNPSEAAGCRRRRAVSGRVRACGSGEQCQLAGDKTSCIARSDAVGRSVDCYFGLERERVEGEREGREWPEMSRCQSLRFISPAYRLSHCGRLRRSRRCLLSR